MAPASGFLVRVLPAALPLAAAAGAVAGGLLVLAGWLLHLPWLSRLGLPGVPVKATTAFAFVLGGFALAGLASDRPGLRIPSRVLAGLVALLGAANLAEWCLGTAVGIDSLVYREPPGLDPNSLPGRPAPLAALHFLLLGTALVLVHPRGPLARTLAAMVATSSLLAFLGYMERLSPLGGVAGETRIAHGSAWLFFALAVGTLFVGPENRFLRIATSPGEAGRVVRVLLPVAILLPVALDLLRQVGRQRGLLDDRLGAGLMVAGLVFAAVVIVWQFASNLFDREQEHAADEDRLRQSAKLEAIGRLAGGVAHDFNNLLAVISGSTEHLAEATGPLPGARDAVRQIERAAERASRLTRQLLAFGRQQHLEPRVVELAAAVAETEGMLRRLIGDRVVLATRGAPGRVRVDPGQLDQVIVNLVVNARDAMPQGGRLELEIAAVELDAAAVADRVEVRPGSYMVLKVIDSGVGMDPETLAHIFEPFFTTKDKGKGTGLGLATVFGIVKQSGGHLTVRSAPGAGSTFAVYLPRVTDPVPAPSSPPVRPVVAPPPATGTLLLVEDEEALRELLEAALARKGYRVLAARDGAHALELSRAHPGPVALLVSDLDLPVLGGSELWARLQVERPGLKAIFMSGYAEGTEGSGEAIAACSRYLQKPFAPRVLVEAVREVLAAPASPVP